MRSNGYWNNDLKYLHLLFVGIVDLIIIMGDEKLDFSNDIMKQGEFIYKYDQLSEIEIILILLVLNNYMINMLNKVGIIQV